MNCKSCHSLIHLELIGRISEAQKTLLDEHLAKCRKCQLLYYAQAGAIEGIKNLPLPEVPEDLPRKIVQSPKKQVAKTIEALTEETPAPPLSPPKISLTTQIIILVAALIIMFLNMIMPVLEPVTLDLPLADCPPTGVQKMGYRTITNVREDTVSAIDYIQTEPPEDKDQEEIFSFLTGERAGSR